MEDDRKYLNEDPEECEEPAEAMLSDKSEKEKFKKEMDDSSKIGNGTKIWKAFGILGICALAASLFLIRSAGETTRDSGSRYQNRIKTLQDSNAELQIQVSQLKENADKDAAELSAQVEALTIENEAVREELLSEVFGSQTVQRGLPFTFYGETEELTRAFGDGWQDRAATGCKAVLEARGGGNSLTMDKELFLQGNACGYCGYVDSDKTRRVGILYYKELDQFLFFYFEGEEGMFPTTSQTAPVATPTTAPSAAQGTSTVNPNTQQEPENIPEQAAYDPTVLTVRSIPGKLTEMLSADALRDRLYSYLYSMGYTSLTGCTVTDCTVYDTYADFTVVLDDGSTIPVEYIAVNNSFSFG